MVIWIAAIAAVGLTLCSEWIHAYRTRRLETLAFGIGRQARSWTRTVPLIRGLAAGLLAWGLLTLLLDVPPKVHSFDGKSEAAERHLVLVLDVSPSMRLVDAGPNRLQSRLHRTRDVLDSMFSRLSLGEHKITVIATYNGALPVVVDTTDSEVVRNILSDLPMHFAFKAGKTKLFDGLIEAAKIAARWKRDSATVVVISDGDTVPPTGMPKMPASVRGVLVVGVGDPVRGTFINGHQSRQDASTLRQMALRLGGSYQDGNKRHVATSILASISQSSGTSVLQRFTKREYALLAIGLGSGFLAIIPLLLHLLGCSWQPGRRMRYA